MFDIAAFLDRAKDGAGNVSDYRLAQLIGVSQPTISLYRNGRRLPEAGVIVRLCDYSGDDPEHVVACVQSMRAANDPIEAEMWQRMAERLRRSSHSIAAGAVVSLAAFGASVTPQGAFAAPASMTPEGVCVLCQIAFAVLLLLRQRMTAPPLGIFPRV